jgi:hypothetical protein
MIGKSILVLVGMPYEKKRKIHEKTAYVYTRLSIGMKKKKKRIVVGMLLHICPHIVI